MDLDTLLQTKVPYLEVDSSPSSSPSVHLDAPLNLNFPECLLWSFYSFPLEKEISI